jgi:hypothetical protein
MIFEFLFKSNFLPFPPFSYLDQTLFNSNPSFALFNYLRPNVALKKIPPGGAPLGRIMQTVNRKPTSLTYLSAAASTWKS